MKLFFYIHFSLFLFFQNSVKASSVFTDDEITKRDSVTYYLNTAKNLNNQKKYDFALEYAQKAKRYAIRNSLKAEIAETYYAVGSILLNLKDYEEAKKVLERSSSISEKFNTKFQVLANYKLAILHAEINDFAESEKYFSVSEKIYNKINPNHTIKNINSILVEKAYLYEKIGKIEQAKSIYNDIITQNRIDNNTINAYVNLSNIVSSDSISWAINKLEFINNQYTGIDEKIKSNIQLALANLHLKQQEPEKAANYLKLLINIEDDTDNLITNSIGNNIVVNKNPLVAKNGQSVEFIKLMSIMSIALIAVLSLLSLSLYRNNKERMRINSLLQIKNSELEIAKNKAEKASKARSEFLSTVSHELRTPLNAINGITHILLEEDPSENQLKYLKSLEFSGDYLLRFINDILEINRVESGNVQLEEISYDIRQLLENIIESFAEISRTNEINCVLVLDNKIPNLLIGDPTKLSQIFMNIIGNAMKFSKQGTVIVSIKELSINNDSIRLHMEVKDTGIGIAEEKITTIFDDFTQGSVEINRKYGGTGLGLAIVKSLVDLLGGEIELESKIGIGSRFFFTIDQKICDKAEVVFVKIEYNEEILKNKHVLIVEDNKINQMITEKMLSKKGMTYETIDNGIDAITIAQEKKFDLILMDIHLPGINGTIATEEIRKFNSYIPIIALTAISLNENREALLAYGMNEVITKPFQPEKFYQTISLTMQTAITF